MFSDNPNFRGAWYGTNRLLNAIFLGDNLYPLMKWVKDIGPGVLIAAAFIGPGTVTLCTITGVSYGYSLIWAIILSILPNIFTRMSSYRIITKMNLKVIRKSVKSVFK